MFCGRKHFSLSSDEDINSLDTAGSLEGVSLPGGDQMKAHLWEYKQVISKNCKFLSSDNFFPGLAMWKKSSYHHCLIIIQSSTVIKQQQQKTIIHVVSILQQSGCPYFIKMKNRFLPTGQTESHGLVHWRCSIYGESTRSLYFWLQQGSRSVSG